MPTDQSKKLVTRSALTQRINRVLARKGQRMSHTNCNDGPHYPSPDYVVFPHPPPQGDARALYSFHKLGEFAREIGVLRDEEVVEEKTVRRSRPLRSLVGRPCRRDGMDDLLEMGIIVATGRVRNGRPVYVLTPLGKKVTANAELIGRAAARRWASPS